MIPQNPDNIAFQLAQEALADSPVFVEHIKGTFVDFVSCHRDGDAIVALNTLARGMADLEQFVQLFAHVSFAAKTRAEATEAFKEQLVDCIRDLETALFSHDLVAVSDSIESVLLPLLPAWDGVVQELHEGLGAQHV